MEKGVDRQLKKGRMCEEVKLKSKTNQKKRREGKAGRGERIKNVAKYKSTKTWDRRKKRTKEKNGMEQNRKTRKQGEEES